MSRLLGKQPWGVRAALLLPLIILVLLSVVVNRMVEDSLADRQVEAFVEQRGATVLTSVTSRLDERQRTKERVVQLLAAEPGLARATTNADAVAAAQVLLPFKTRLELGFVAVYDSDGRPILHLDTPALGGAQVDRLAAALLVAAASGLTQSAVTAGDTALVVLAATPVKGPQGIVGALVVGTALDGVALAEIADRETVELAIFRGGRLVATTARPEIAQLLAETSLDAAEPDRAVDAALAPYHFHLLGRTIGADGLLLVLVPTDDLVGADQQREAIEVGGSIALVAALLLLGLLLARRIARPLGAAVAATGAIVAGDYRQRVPPSRIRELNDLANGVNHLAARVAGQLNDLRRQNEHLAGLGDTGRALGGELDPEHAIALAWAQVARIGGVADGWIALCDEGGDVLDFRLFMVDGQRYPEGEGWLARAEGRGLAWALVDGGAQIRTPDYLAECHRRGATPNDPRHEQTNMVWLGLPLATGGRIIGALAVWRGDVPFADDEAATLTTLAGQIAAALANTRLYATAQAELIERRQVEAALRASEAGLATAQQLAHLGSWEIDLATGATYWSAEAFRIFGLAPHEVTPTFAALLSAVHPDDRARVARIAEETAATATSRSIEYRVVRPDGTVRVVHDQSQVVGASGGPLRRVGAILDITERRALEQRLEHQAFHDSLTGLPNRALFLDRLGHALDRAARDGPAVSVLLLDLDGFKHVNDSLGHAAGDRLLVAFAARFPDCCLRPGDTLARLGGDEFAILLESVRDPRDAVHVAERITTCPALRAPYSIEGREVVIGTSVGVVVSRSGAAKPDELLRDADLALYRAKAAGRGGYANFDPAMNVTAMARLELEADLHQAAGRTEFALVYQPVVGLAEGRMVRAEALLRWTHPTRGAIPPLDFIPLAEESGLIREIGRWVLGEACHQAAAWRRRFGEQAPVVCVNLSAREFADPDLASQVAAALRESGLEPAGLELEITEGVLMGDAPGTLATLWQLKALGVGLAVDDFGTGYSSLAYLKRFPVDTLKIDKTFVDGLETDGDDTAIVRAVIGLAHALGLIVVAEGVETADQMVGLRLLGCDLAQGYHFARPMAAAALDTLLADGVPGLAGAAGQPPLRPIAVPSTGELHARREARAHRPGLLPARPTNANAERR